MIKQVMIIEDNEATRKALSMYVKEESPAACVDEFANVDGAYDAALTKNYSLFLVDIVIYRDRINDMSGMEFVNRIRTVDKYRFTPVIFITSLEDPSLYAVNELHSYAYIEKPFSEKYVRQKIREALMYQPNFMEDKNVIFRIDGIIFPVKTSDIIFMEYLNRGLNIHKRDGKALRIPYMTCRQAINEVGEEYFIQCNRNTLLNKQLIEYVDKVNGYIKMTGCQDLFSIGVVYSKKINGAFK